LSTGGRAQRNSNVRSDGNARAQDRHRVVVNTVDLPPAILCQMPDYRGRFPLPCSVRG